MPTPKKQYRCGNCNEVFPKWQGQCPKCKEWNVLVEETAVSGSKGGSPRSIGMKSSGASSTPSVAAARVKDISTSTHSHLPTGVGEFDRVLGGGLVPGGVILLAGDPGVGKSTLLLEVAGKAAQNGRTTLIISGEESREQIALRAQRVGALSDDLLIASEIDLSKVLGHIDQVQPDFVIIDSIQTIASPEIDSRVGDRSQVNEVASILTRVAKEHGIPIIMIGHVTKDGNIAGPRTVEHLVDVVLYFEGDPDSSLRLLRGIKNRYGPSDEIGCFEHSESGILEVPDPSGLLLGRRDEAISGVVTAISIEGRRPLPIEIQALVAGSQLPVPRRAVSGLDMPRTTMVQAVVERHGGVRLSDKDVFVSTIGGMRTREPSVDLATALALASAAKDYIIPLGLVAIGEVTLSGEIRRVPGVARRLTEAYRLGFKEAIVPQGSEIERAPQGMRIRQVRNMREAINLIS